MYKFAIPLLFLAFIATGARGLSSGSESDSGKDIFKAQKCMKCHTIASQGIERSGAPPPGKLPPDLSGVGLKHNADWMKQWLTKKVEMNGKKHLKKFTGDDDELTTITAWLATLRKS